MSDKKIFNTSSPEETVELGRQIGKELKAGAVAALIGELGAGKTSFTQGIAEGLDVTSYVKSPSFTIVNEYKGRLPVYHIDLYRLGNINEIHEFGIEEYFYGDGVTIIEWAEKAYPLLPARYLLVKFFYTGENSRKIEVTFIGSTKAD